MDVSIIIVTWNVCDLVSNCLSSLYSQEEGPAFEVWLVDNASTDKTIERIGQRFSDVNVVANAVNVGFPAANNQAVPRCLGRYLLYLNPDTVVQGGALAAMTRFMDEHPDVGLVGPRIVHPNGEVQMDAARNFPDLLGVFTEASFLRRLFPRNRLFGHQNMTYWNHAGSRDVPCLVGAAMMVRREAAEEIGWDLDATIPMYFEDIDYCYRIRRAGWRVHYLADATITHFYGASTSRAPSTVRFEEMKWRAYELFFQRYRPRYQTALLRLIVLVCFLIRIPVIGLAVLVRGTSSKNDSRFVSAYTLRKAIAMVKWSLGIRRPITDRL